MYAYFFLLVLQIHVIGANSPIFKCRSIETQEKWLTQEGIIFASHDTTVAVQPCPENVTIAMELAGMCLFCSISRIVACYGSQVTRLPLPSELPPTLDRFQVSNSDVRYIPSEAFFNRTIREIYIENNVLSLMNQRAFQGSNGVKILSLANNNLPYVLVNTFNELPDLKTLILDDNSLEFTYSGDYIHSNARDYSVSLHRLIPTAQRQLSLETFSLRNNPLRILPKAAFTWLSHSRLQYLSMRSCSIENSHPEALLPLQPTLLELELGDVSNIGPSLANVTAGLRDGRLQRLGLSSCGLVQIPNTALLNVASSLAGLSLQGNTFHHVGMSAFPDMPMLKTLDMRRCSIVVLGDGAFNGLTSLNSLLLSGNRFKTLNKPFYELSNLMYLDLSGNPDLELSETDDAYVVHENTFTGLDNLFSLNLGNSRILKLHFYSFSKVKNLTHLSLCNTVIKNIPPKKLFHPLTALKTLDLSGSIKLAARLHPEWFDGLNALIELYLSNCEIETLKENLDLFQHLENLQILDLSNNMIRHIISQTFSSLLSLTALYLNGNRLGSWNEPIFSNNQNLSQISLSNNQIGYLTNIMIEEMLKLRLIAMQDNPLYCDCILERFVTEIANSSEISVEQWSDESEAYTCYEPKSMTTLKLSSLPEYKLCENSAAVPEKPDGDSTNFPIAIVICSLSLIVSLVFAVAYRKRNNLRYFALMVKNAMNVALMDDTDTNEEETIYNYDVFVSYCEADRDWVVEQLLPSLERDAQLRVCLHERDFQPGYGILDNIIHCIDKSRSLLIIVSKRSLKSQWCQFEMHLAQHRLIETKREQLILVLMSNIPKSQRPRTLHYLMATRTYLIWNAEQSAVFWKRLKRALLLDPAVHGSSFA